LPELHDFLITEKGKAWAKKYGYDPAKLTANIEADPFYNGAKLRTKNSQLSWGDVTALMGDYFGTPDDLYQASDEKLHGKEETVVGDSGPYTRFKPGLLSIADRERKGTITEQTATIAYEEITGRDYLRLAQKNASHFAPVNRETFLSMHKDAIKIAAGLPHSEASLQKALFLDASADHFLTDAFASGHLLDQGKVLAAISIYLAQHPIQAGIPEMQTFIGFASLTNKAQFLVLKIIHDHFNTAGHEVSNPKGMTWRTYGDSHLREAPETRHIAALAVFLARTQIYDVYKDKDVNPQDVIDLMPDDKTIDKVTEEAIRYIPTAAGEVDKFMLAQRNAAESQFGTFGGAAARYILNQIDRRLEQNPVLPGEQPVGDILHPDFSIGMDFILDRDAKKNPDSLHLDISVGQPKGYESSREWQVSVGLTKTF